jgi:hypothetical protein
VRAGADGALDRLDDLRVRVPDDHRSEAAVVSTYSCRRRPTPSRPSLAQVDRVRIADLERRRDAERHRTARPLVQLVRNRRRVDEPSELELGDLARAAY